VRHERYDSQEGCPVERTLELIGGKWKGVLLYHLLDGTKRFNELRRMFPGLTQRVLTAQLRELERDGLVRREVYAQVPPKVEYSLTERGTTLEPLLLLMRDWGERNLPEMTGGAIGEEPPSGAPPADRRDVFAG
jgi:DNA-binding HxlR family transcriptional regulator